MKKASALILCFSIAAMCYAAFGPYQSPENTKTPVNAVVAEYEPAFAVRASACITCHAKVQPACITDFGYGDRYYFGGEGGIGVVGHFVPSGCGPGS